MATATQALPQSLRAARKALGYSQAALAKRVGITQSAISSFERGTTTPTIATLKALSSALEITVGQLLTETEEAQ